MHNITFTRLNEAEPQALLSLMNCPIIRKHLMPHPAFNLSTLQQWIKGKLDIDRLPGCRIRAIAINNHLSGWCGIQPDDDKFEIAIVLNQSSWGAGRRLFNIMLNWAHELQHKEITFHLLGTRPEYNSLIKKAIRYKKSTLSGHAFSSYTFMVDSTSTK